MAPSGEHRPEDLGAATIRAAAVAASNAAAALRNEVGRLHLEGKGLTVAKSCEEMTARAGAAEKLSTSLAATAKALTIREDAAKAWNRDAPKDSEIKVAEEAVTAAKKKLQDASAASGDTSVASKELETAQKKLGDLRRRRRDADKAYDAAEKRADLELAKIAPQDISDDAPGTGAPGTGTTTPSTGRPSGETGKRSDPSKTPGGTAKPAATPTGTPSPSSAKPTENSSGDDLSGLLTQLAAQQQQQPAQAQAQPTAAAPTAAAPVASTPQQQEKKDTPQSRSNPLDRLLGSDGVLDVGDLGALGVALGGDGAPAPVASSGARPAATVTPSAPASSAPSTTGLSAGTVTQPVTSGTSAANLHTTTDVSGRPAEQQRSAFSVGPETKTSGATGTGTSGTAPASATGTRPMGAGGMPMMPMGGMGGPGGGAGKDREQAQTALAAGSTESDIIHGRHTVAEAVPGGTIAQKDHPRRRGEDAA
ncbi:hypothetical protein HBE99_02635 [Mycobacteroides chelonae]|uniref:hypothetical protein n=1 Tax=Mycobacteroides chelonae TaxID=1774 RepID=UPI00190FE02F|nr:hypothetical protein [Mycobacteroides chelonae]QQG95897.1 hypothetical protein HBE99_02635 [Mycobacteroides chelonae]